MPTDQFNISGTVAPGFEPVHDAFISNFNDGSEAGAGVCVWRDGDPLVDLTGGTRDRKQETPWTPDTLVPVYSSTKAATSLVIAF